jgi:hypothetical protein
MAMIILPMALLCTITLPHTTKDRRLNPHASEKGKQNEVAYNWRDINSVPDWLWQRITTNPLADGLWAAGWSAWRYREEIANKPRRTSEDMVINLQPLTLHAETQPVSITVGKSADLKWKVEAPTPPLGGRLEGLVFWHLHVS